MARVNELTPGDDRQRALRAALTPGAFRREST